MRKQKAAFICVHNSCRSQIAEALGRHLAGDVFESYSAGTETKPQINQDAVRLMKEIYNIDMEKEGQYSKLIDVIPEPDIAISMGCNVGCPFIGRDFDDNWGLEDPTGGSDEEFRTVITEIEKRIKGLRDTLLKSENMKTVTKIDIYGLGALGTMYAAVFSEKLGKENVRVLADAKRIERYEKEGCFFNDKKCDLQFRDVSLETEPSQVLMFCVKYGGLEKAMKEAAHLIGKDTILISVLNGIRSEEDLARAFGAEKIVGCTAQKMDATKEANKVRCSNIGELALGLLDGGKQENLNAVTELFDKIDFRYVLPDDMKRALWSKLVCNVGVNQTVALYGGTYRCVQEPGVARKMMRQAMRECVAVAQAEKIDLTEDEVELWTKIIDQLGSDGEPSMRQDAKAGRTTEVDLFAGTICELGKKHGIPTPVNDRFLEHFSGASI